MMHCFNVHYPMLHCLILHHLLLFYLMLRYVNMALFHVVLPFTQPVCRSTGNILVRRVCTSDIQTPIHGIKLELILLILLDKRCYFTLLLLSFQSCDPCVSVPCVCVLVAILDAVTRGWNDDIIQHFLCRGVTFRS